jgi:hypothetical protein
MIFFKWGPLSHINVQIITALNAALYSTEVSLISTTILEHIDAFVTSRHDFKNSVVVEIGSMDSQPFTNSSFHFIISVESTMCQFIPALFKRQMVHPCLISCQEPHFYHDVSFTRMANWNLSVINELGTFNVVTICRYFLTQPTSIVIHLVITHNVTIHRLKYSARISLYEPSFETRS